MESPGLIRIIFDRLLERVGGPRRGQHGPGRGHDRGLSSRASAAARLAGAGPVSAKVHSNKRDRYVTAEAKKRREMSQSRGRPEPSVSVSPNFISMPIRKVGNHGPNRVDNKVFQVWKRKVIR